MPKSQSLNKQRGSIMVVVVSLSVIMTLAASGYLMLVSNSSSSRDFLAEDRALHYAAESGLMMGVAWITSYEPDDFPETWPGPDGKLLHFGSSINLDGHIVKVSIEGEENGYRIMKSVATKSIGEMEETITWRFRYPPLTNNFGGSIFNPLNQYNETRRAHSE